MPPLTIHTEMRIVLEGVAPWSSADKRRIEGQTTVRDRCNGGCDQELELLSAGGMPFKALPEYYAMEKRSHRFVLAFAVRACWHLHTSSCRVPGRSDWSRGMIRHRHPALVVGTKTPHKPNRNN